MLEQWILEYGGFSSARGRCHVVSCRERQKALVGDPQDNPGTSVTSAIEQVAFELSRVAGIDVTQGGLHQYVPWDPRTRGEWLAHVEFRADVWSMPVWGEPLREDSFVLEAVSKVNGFVPYALSEMGDLELRNAVVRLRVPVSGDLISARQAMSAFGTIQHISQHRYFYVDVPVSSHDESEAKDFAVDLARVRLAAFVDPETITVTSPNAPLDQPNSIL